MAIYRTVQMTFWTDSKVVDDFTPEDKYFYLYLMTNPHTNLAGCYEISFKQMADETGYSRDTVERLIDRLENVHEVIKFSKKTKEVLICNWSSYNWTRSEKFLKALVKNVEQVKDLDFKAFLEDLIKKIDTVSIPYEYRTDTTVTDTDIISNKYIESIKTIIDYLNIKTNKKFKDSCKSTQDKIKARLKDGYTIDDFKTVIDNKCEEWLNDKSRNKYLRPETLFAPSHFESYLNESKQTTNPYDFV